jgi:DNA polymerase-1
MNKLLLIDGNAIVHRAFHALPFLNNKGGIPTNAVYGFFAMVLKVIADIQPTNVIVCFDRPKPNFRQQLYVGYQATRPKMADELTPQFKTLIDVLKKADFCVFGVDGYEADDLIGTLSREATEKKMDAIILSGDRDLLQLVNHHIKLLTPIVGVTKTLTYDEAAVHEKYGLWPYQFIDYKALIGDASDNYPGVSGIGPKTAMGLINKYNTVEEIYSHLSDIPPKISEKLATDAEQAMLAKKLATILTNAPVKLDVKKCKVVDINHEELLDSFIELGFHSLIKRFFGGEEDSSVEVQKTENPPSPRLRKDKEKDDDQLNLL